MIDLAELKAFRKRLSRAEPTLPALAKPFARNIVQQIKEYLAAGEAQRKELRFWMSKALMRFEASRQGE